jgi:leucyl-tRNA synthetase
MSSDGDRVTAYDPHTVIDTWAGVWDDLRVYEAGGLTEGDDPGPRRTS